MILGTSGTKRPKHCGRCRKVTMHESGFALGAGALTFLTCGLFLPFWILGQLWGSHYRCQTCGTKRRP
jgi:hypothetical protein